VSASISEVVDGLIAVVEPEPTAVTKDPTLMRPYEWQANTLYGFPSGIDDHALAGVGNPPQERENFETTLVFVLDRGDEEAKLQPRREVSVDLYDRAHAYAGRVAANRSRYADDYWVAPLQGQPTPWQHVASQIDFSYLDDFNARGFGLIVRGYRFLS
jgi:hypothetical protein